MTEGNPHFKAKIRLVNIVMLARPDAISTEYRYPNPKNTTGDPLWDWRFDVYFRIGKRFVALEVDGQNRDGEKGHSSKKSFEKREFKKEYLKSKGIELFGWPRRWIIGRKALDDDLFLEEMHLTRRGITKEQIEYGKIQRQTRQEN